MTQDTALPWWRLNTVGVGTATNRCYGQSRWSRTSFGLGMADTDERPDVAEHPVRDRHSLALVKRGGRAVLVVLAVLILVVLGVAYWDDLGGREDGISAPQAGHGQGRLTAGDQNTSGFSALRAARVPSGWPALEEQPS